jgi:hypothetical protein
MKKIIKSLLLLVLILLSSCGLFEPRDNEEPENPAEWIDYPINREQVLMNLKFSYKYPENQNKYNEIFTDDFIFEFASQDISEHSTPSQIDFQEEASIIFNMHKILGDYNEMVRIDSLTKIEGQEDILDSASAILFRNYYLKVMDANSEIELRNYRGKAQFNLVQDPETSLWKIESWKDFRTTTNETWGLFKNEYLF